VHWRRHSRELGFNLDSARSPADVYSLDTESNKLERWTVSETGGLNTTQLPEPQLIHWKSWDGRTISGFLYRPPERFSGPRPVMILIHGGPEGQFRPDFLGSTNYYLE
jgi:dipeptidyl aminopeptidase/acylaminoacyl peptidase